MKLFEPIVVDLYKPFPLKKVDMQQNNIGRGVIVTLTAGSTIVDPSDEDVKLWAERPDGNISYLACTVQADGTIRAPFSSQMLSVPGEVVVSLEMISGEDDITTPIFKVGVGRNIADHTAAESQNEFSALQESISAVNAALAKVKELEEKGLSKVTFSAYADFPEVGNAEMLYVDTSDTEKLMMYRWSGTEYAPAGVDVVDPALATVLGFAADAKLTGDALSELNKKTVSLTENTTLKYGRNPDNTSYIRVENENGAFQFVANSTKFKIEEYENSTDKWTTKLDISYLTTVLTLTTVEQSAYEVSKLIAISRNKVVDLYFTVKPLTTGITSWTTVAKLPNTHLPQETIYKDFPYWDASKGYENIRLRIQKTGEIQFTRGTAEYNYVTHDTFIAG